MDSKRMKGRAKSGSDAMVANPHVQKTRRPEAKHFSTVAEW